jgi:hypothetical protein
MILLSSIEYPKLKSNEGIKLRKYCKIFAIFLTLSKPLKSKITFEPKAPRRKFSRIIPFCASDSELNKKLNTYVIDIIGGPYIR